MGFGGLDRERKPIARAKFALMPQADFAVYAALVFFTAALYTVTFVTVSASDLFAFIAASKLRRKYLVTTNQRVLRLGFAAFT